MAREIKTVYIGVRLSERKKAQYSKYVTRTEFDTEADFARKAMDEYIENHPAPLVSNILRKKT